MSYVVRVVLLVFVCVASGRSSALAADDDAVPKPDGVDVGDLWQRVRHKPDAPQSAAEKPPPTRFFVFAPTIGSKPSTGLTGGISGSLAFFAGDASATRISSFTGGLRVSQQGQTSAGARLSAFTPGDGWFVSADSRLSLTSLNVYPLGGDTVASDGEKFKYDFMRMYGAAYRKVRPGVFVGAGVNLSRHSNIRAADGSVDASTYAAYSAKNGLPSSTQASSGTSVGLLLDTRDNSINAQRGYMAAATLRTFFGGFLGGNSKWDEVSVDARTYRSLTGDGRRKLAFWFLTDLVTGGMAPYLDLPATGGDNYSRLARGYAEGRYRGEKLVYGEIEYRNTLTSNGLVGFVAFLNATTIGGHSSSTKLFDTAAPGAGLGLRVLLNKQSKTNLCADYGWGRQNSRGFYLAIQEAF